jgi:hypothetical protein
VIDAFNRNVECGMPILAEHCPPEAGALVVDIREQLQYVNGFKIIFNIIYRTLDM